MSLKSQFQTLFTYHWHTTEHLMQCAAELDEADYHDDPGYGHGSIHQLLFHLLDTDRGWRIALETGQQPARLSLADFPDLASLRLVIERERGAWRALLERLSSDEVEGNVILTSLQGRTTPFPRWRILQHLVLHGMQHHTELAQLITEKGESPGDIDFIFFK